MSQVRPANTQPTADAGGLAARIGLLAGPLVAVAVYLALGWAGAELSGAARACAAVGSLMALWWMTEAIPLEATALLPLVLFPLLGATPDLESAAVPYADESIFLYLGGFLLALAVEKQGLHRRLALATLAAVGTQPVMLVGGFMLSTALISMWISNTATTLMMLPIGVSVVHLLTEKLGTADDSRLSGDAARLATSLLLGIAYAASIGGLGTLIGTPPNTLFKGFMEDQGIVIGFGRWMLFALPICAVFLFLSWLVITKLLFPVRIGRIAGGRELIRAELLALGRMSRGEWIVLCVFGATALLWVSREPLSGWPWLVQRVPAVERVSDAMIGMGAALCLFVLPVRWRDRDFALDWRTASRMPYGVLLLFGGGLSLAKTMSQTQLDLWIGRQVEGLAGLPLPALVITVVMGVVLFSELASNLATAAALLPVLFAVTRQLSLDPLTLCIPAILAASCGFMLPVATPPNTIVFATGHISMRQMMRAGIWLDLIGVVLISLASFTLGKWIFGIGR